MERELRILWLLFETFKAIIQEYIYSINTFEYLRLLVLSLKLFERNAAFCSGSHLVI